MQAAELLTRKVSRQQHRLSFEHAGTCRRQWCALLARRPAVRCACPSHTLCLQNRHAYSQMQGRTPPCREVVSAPVYLFAGPKTGVVHRRKREHLPSAVEKHFLTRTEHTLKVPEKQRAACPPSCPTASLPTTNPSRPSQTTRGAAALPATLLLPGRTTLLPSRVILGRRACSRCKARGPRP